MSTVTSLLLLEFDLAEPWDCAVDMVKLTWDTFPRFAGVAEIYQQRYFAGAPEPDRWAERVWVAGVMELLNVVPNAISIKDLR